MKGLGNRPVYMTKGKTKYQLTNISKPWYNEVCDSKIGDFKVWN